MSHLAHELAQSHSKQQEEEPQQYQHAISWLTGWAAFSFAVLLGFSRLSYGFLLPVIRVDLQSSYSILGAIATVNFVGYLLGALMMPVLLVRIRNRVRLNFIGVLATSLTMIASTLSFTLWELGTWRLFTGIFSAIGTILTMALTLEAVYPKERGQASGIIWMGGALGVVISGVIAPPIIGTGNYAGWRLIWILMGLAGVVTAIGFFMSCRGLTHFVTRSEQTTATTDVASTQRSLWATLRPLFLPQRLLWLSLAYFCFGGGYIAYLTYFIALLQQQGVPSLYAGFVWAAMGLAAAISSWIWGRFLDRWPTGFTLAVSLALGVIGSLTVLTNTPAIEYVGAAIVGLSSMLAPPIIATVLLKRAVPDAEYAINYSTITTLFSIGQILGPVIGGIVIGQFGLQAGIVTSSVLLGVAALSAYGYGLAQRKLS